MSKLLPPKRILLVDDHPLIREGLSLRLSTQDDLKVCGEAATEDEAIALAKSTNPDLMLIDISLKSGHGIEVVKRVKACLPNVKMLVLSGYAESLYAERALRAGAQGYLNKQESNEKLLEAIHTVLAGQRYVSAETMQRLVSHAIGASDETKSPVDCLSDRELEVFRLIGEGLTSGTIANQLFLSTHTIDSHRENIKRKLSIRSAGELNRAAVQWVLENG